MIDLGTQLVDFQGQQKKQHKVLIGWELPEERMGDNRPFTISKRYTLSSSKKARLRQDLEAWRGVAFTDDDYGRFDLGVLIGKSCLMGIIHETRNGTTYANISALMKLAKGQSAPPLTNPTLYFALNDFNQDVFDSLSEGLRAVIAKSPEYQALKGGHALEQSTPDDAANEGYDFDERVPF